MKVKLMSTKKETLLCLDSATNYVECSHCGELLAKNEASKRGENFYCDDCIDSIIKCADCGEYHHEDDLQTVANGDLVCEDCRENYFYCEHCEQLYSEGEIEGRGNNCKCLCDDCFERSYAICDDCGDCVRTDDTYETAAGTTICDSCRDSYITCDECGELYPNDDTNYNDDDDCYYCNDCQGERNTKVIYNYHGWKKEFKLINITGEQNPLYMGFELEVGRIDSRSKADDIAKSVKDKYDPKEEIFHFENDSSIPYYGFEIISHPMTLASHKLQNYKELFTDLIKEGAKSHDCNSECGLHIHINKDYLNDMQTILLDYFVNTNNVEFSKLARRASTQYTRFKKDDVGKVKNKYGKNHRGRYEALNFQRENTIEFRLWRGTLKIETFTATLEIVDALVNFVKQDYITPSFFVKERGNTFRCLYEYICKYEKYENAKKYIESKIDLAIQEELQIIENPFDSSSVIAINQPQYEAVASL